MELQHLPIANCLAFPQDCHRSAKLLLVRCRVQHFSTLTALGPGRRCILHAKVSVKCASWPIKGVWAFVLSFQLCNAQCPPRLDAVSEHRSQESKVPVVLLLKVAVRPLAPPPLPRFCQVALPAHGLGESDASHRLARIQVVWSRAMALTQPHRHVPGPCTRSVPNV